MGLFDGGLGNNNGMSPAAIALLGLLAVKGFENRDKLAGMLGGVLGGGNDNNPQGQPQSAGAGGLGGLLGGAGGGGLGGLLGGAGGGGLGGGLGGLLGGLGGALGGGNATPGNVVSGGIGDLLNGFRQAGHGDVADSWVKDGPNQQPQPQQIEQAVGPNIIDQLAKETGISRDELLQRLTHELPKAVDGLTPDGRVPTPQEAEPRTGWQV